MGKLRAVGFCGADDSVSPQHVVLIAKAFPLVEFGVLLRPDKEGQPRYATKGWVDRFSKAADGKIKLAAHLCGSRVNDVLEGKSAFLDQLLQWGFRRVQINATAVNGVDTSNLAGSVATLLDLSSKYPSLEFIIQKNEETKPMWEGLLSSGIPSNMSMLVDESKGTGKQTSTWPEAPDGYQIGYAGGIGPSNARSVLETLASETGEKEFWIDMESSLRSIKNEVDVFDLDKCFEVIEIVQSLGHM